MATTEYIRGDCLTDSAILNTELLSQCGVATTTARSLPKKLSMKDSDAYDYYTKNVRILYPGASNSITMIIPNVVLHCDTFDHFTKIGVYVGVPQEFVELMRTKLVSIHQRPVFEDTGLASDEHYWWTRAGFTPAEMEREYIFIVTGEEEDMVEDAFGSFQDLFVDVGSSVVANVTCSMKMTTKVEVERKGAIAADSEWKMGLSITRVNVVDTIDVAKPRGSISQKSIPGAKDKASSRLLTRIRQRVAVRGELLAAVSKF